MRSNNMNERLVIRGAKIPEISEHNVCEIFMENIQQHSERVAFIDGVTKQELRYAEVEELVLRMAVWMGDQHITAGDTVAICSENNIYYVIPVLAAHMLGAIIAPLNPDYTTRELSHTINLSKPQVILCSPSTIDSIRAASKQYQYVKHVKLFWSEKKTDDAVMNILPLIEQGRTKHVKIFDNDVNDVALIMCSSGTTGLPKGVMVTHRNILSLIKSTESDPEEIMMYENQCRPTIANLPFFHAFGLVVMLFHLKDGLTQIIMKKFMPDVFLQAIQDYKISMITTVPPILSFLSKHPLPLKYDLSSLLEVRCGAAPISKEIEELLLKRLPNVKSIRQGYGMTESTLGITRVPKNKYKAGSAGIVKPGVDIKIINPETGVALGPYQPGELCYRGQQVMKGYIGNEEATKATIDSEGWARSGDVAYYDNEGWFFIVDRLKELIKYKAFQVAPAELEALLIKHPRILDAAVIGIPDEDSGELPKAFVVPKCTITEKEILQYIEGEVSNPKRLRGGVEFISEIPKTKSGKILRRELRNRVKKSKL